jgi:hypothetical protein
MWRRRQGKAAQKSEKHEQISCHKNLNLIVFFGKSP